MKYLIKEDVAITFLDFFMGDDSPLSTKKEYMSSRSINPCYTHVIKCISKILEKFYTPNIDFNYKISSTKGTTFSLE